MKHLTLLCVLLVATCATATQYSCLSIITNAKRIGKWPALKSWIVAADLKDEWDKCAYVSDDYPQFSAVTNALVSAGVLTASELEDIISSSKDTAIPDAALRRVYTSDVRTGSGRQRWHGRKLSETVDTNAMRRVTVYEDGTRFTDVAVIRRPADAVSKANAKLPKPVMTNGIPARLAAARLRLRTEANTVSNVTVNVTAGR